MVIDYIKIEAVKVEKIMKLSSKKLATQQAIELLDYRANARLLAEKTVGNNSMIREFPP